MKIVFSRKGFDSQYGKKPSPIFPDGKMLSLPLPVDGKTSKTLTCYKDLSFGAVNLGKLVNDLTVGKISQDHPVHLDPDLRKKSMCRDRGWVPMFCLSSESHLRNQGVGLGDIVLFFGTFQSVRLEGGSYLFQKKNKPIHALFGWIQIKFLIPAGKIFRVDAPRWAKDHPHFHNEWGGSEGEQLVLAYGDLSLPGLKCRVPAGGTFDHYSENLKLTANRLNMNKSVWRLPADFGPERGRSLLSFHSKEKWTRCRTDNSYVLRTVAKGQDFVFNADERPKALSWLADIFNSTHCRS